MSVPDPATEGAHLADTYLRDAILTTPPTAPAPATAPWGAPPAPATQAPPVGTPPATAPWGSPPAAPWATPPQQTVPQQPVHPHWAEPPAPPPAAPQVSPRVPTPEEIARAAQLSDEDLETYRDSLPIIHKILAAQSAPLVAEIEHLRRQSTSASENDFLSRVKETLGREGIPMEQVVQDPRWRVFLNSQVAGHPFSYGDSIQTAHNARDMTSLRAAFHTFLNGIGQAPAMAAPAPTAVPFGAPPAPAQPQAPAASMSPAHAAAMAAQAAWTAQSQQSAYPPTSVTPATGTSGMALPVNNTAAAPTLKWSTYENASNEYIAGRLPLAAFARIKELYEPVMGSDRIDYKS